ncbi:UDP-N-acetylmuramoyl-tripeptide--D-alanyl-D-alanine ligase [Fructilactobacillus lindneri]|uniref:UDP-N-acetylmuramoyl-tripeptide--D-alanyl-D-alanine ligase n=1 Tax=Fructilactobacillus lindneri TaxID=53444 RepID=A0AB33BR69_9LACO|nr:UDP-N-acetylmuramoyl-tripeptide--D-alanyl-D-alanine ligase [Fructilactobacillus lindneri]ANZ57333.1 UDP-N-acetylmuramoyl-tripeptide--D-alanyl-D-alanine ligase [Fructilactobacillus lindneri]ANZ58598.1 UDP-N-acetylmuramoyl-tripeptide--D-alanyl-D-alanine ligase [Fructilactobacillus lindneri]POG97636.1 UDP-N-acetylmuramoyl-tripeptide--D-alanyl-D-alanine ligase [Fructilactobacillus lindneri]POG98973.1 UDP-N-acetylmuramoyl-tripeptide--D-alanyl-D-alanine ligase [Fructilactobacillus lindneri]POG992
MRMKLDEIAKAVDGTLSTENVPDEYVTSVAFDSRKLEPGSLFVPLVGDNDGHDYIQSAIDNGAVGSFWANDHKDKAPTDFPVILVNDPLQALQDLAKYYLAKINPKVVAVTGSNGKTTTKDLIASIVGMKFNVIKTQGNFNNQIGVPITILSMSSNTEVLVVEMGMDHSGQLKTLSNLVNPDIAVITMIGEAHIEFFGTRDRIADAKLEITDGLREDGYFVYNGDEPLLNERAEKVNAFRKTFGREGTNDIYHTEIEAGDENTKFETNLWNDYEFMIHLIGDYNVNNALAALEVGDLLKISPSDMRKGLEHANLTKNRTEWIKGNQGEMILSDVYNSNPTAVKAVLAAFESTHVAGKRLLVLGDMLELGDDSQAMHASLADSIDPDQISDVFLIGNDMKALYEALENKYQPQKNLHYYPIEKLPELVTDLKAAIEPNDEVLLKGSHGMHLENVLDELTGPND